VTSSGFYQPLTKPLAGQRNLSQAVGNQPCVFNWNEPVFLPNGFYLLLNATICDAGTSLWLGRYRGAQNAQICIISSPLAFLLYFCRARLITAIVFARRATLERLPVSNSA